MPNTASIKKDPVQSNLTTKSSDPFKSNTHIIFNTAFYKYNIINKTNKGFELIP